ncbi:MAG: chromosome segregation protein SMC [Clostridia bacterium]|nr:chromosome segregation protein SMC [Clostridia bacterium]
MLLKSLEIQGFKTFPDKTKLTFDKGITSVVGPNGSGKSNISDAIRWVLGEQSTKALRCARMEDVVFKGTDTRKKNGFAEVTLTIENKDRVLPYDGDDVSVTRRFYRSGESEYLINKATVRLKDIHELFMDTGLGRDGYSMISQGKIDSIVSSKSEERREIFEEAAGISRYRYRKSEAERRLKSTQENLYRLKDILAELEGRVDPLRIQSEKAEKFLEYSKEKKGLEIALWLDTLNKSENALREQEEKLSVANADYSSIERELEQIRIDTEELYKQFALKNVDIDSIRNSISVLEQDIAQINESIVLAKNDISHNNQEIDRLTDEIKLTEESCSSLENLCSEKSALITEKKSIIERSLIEYAEKAKSLNTINEDALKYSDKTQKLTTRLASLNSKCAEARIKEMSASSSLEEIGNRLADLRTSKEEAEKSIQNIEKYILELESHSAQCKEKIQSSKQSLDGCRMLYNNRISKAEKLKQEADKIYLDYKEYERRTKILEDLEKNLEGFSNSVKAVMKEVSHGVLSGIIGPISRIINVPSKYATAIEIALGAAMQNIVCIDEQSAKSAIAFLKRTNSGRATFLPLTNIKSNIIHDNSLQSNDGYVGIANSLCEYESRFSEIIGSLLGRTVIVSDIDCATTIAKKYNYKYKIVTLDGQVVNAGGSLTGGSFGKKSGILSRSSDIQSYREKTKKLQKQADELIAQYKVSIQKAEKVKADILVFEADIANNREDKIKFDTEIQGRKSELENSKRALKLMIEEDETSSARTKSFMSERESAHQRIEELSRQIIETEADIALITGDKDKISKNKEILNEELEKIRLQTAVLEKEIEALTSEIDSAKINSQNQFARKQELLERIEEVSNINKEKDQTVDLYTLQSQQKNSECEKLKEEINKINEERLDLDKQATLLRQNERDKQTQRENIARELTRLEERKISLQKKYDDIISKLWDEYELTKNEAERESIQIDNSTLANKRLNELKSKIRNLGSINVSAIEEYKEVFERYTFMSKQVGDVEQSKEDIEKLINDLVKQMATMFVQRFNEINKNFGETFKELFGGGRASLELTNPDDILGSGIDIICNPPGKIVEHLELLSGGEKALVAISLYFAIMKVSPAPFCVMDEIEAALDDVNVYRFAEYLRRMNDKTQFILITHRRGTMEEADVLYGVTMQDKGISKLLELRATEVAEKLGKIG